MQDIEWSQIYDELMILVEIQSHIPPPCNNNCNRFFFFFLEPITSKENTCKTIKKMKHQSEPQEKLDRLQKRPTKTPRFQTPKNKKPKTQNQKPNPHRSLSLLAFLAETSLGFALSEILLEAVGFQSPAEAGGKRPRPSGMNHMVYGFIWFIGFCMML